jgi:hypothetical protein
MMFFDLIMAEPAGIPLLAGETLQLDISFVVWTPQTGIFQFFGIKLLRAWFAGFADY